MRLLWECEENLVQLHGKLLRRKDVKTPMVINHEFIVKKIRKTLEAQDFTRQWWLIEEYSPVKEGVYPVITKNREFKLDGWKDGQWLSMQPPGDLRQLGDDDMSTAIATRRNVATAKGDDNLYWIDPPESEEWGGAVHGSWGWRYCVTELPYSQDFSYHCKKMGSRNLHTDVYNAVEKRWMQTMSPNEQWWKPRKSDDRSLPSYPPLPPL